MNQETSNPACFRRAVALWEGEAISNQEALLAPRRKPSLTPVVLVSEPVVVASLSYPDPLQAWVIRFRFWYSRLFFFAIQLLRPPWCERPHADGGDNGARADGGDDGGDDQPAPRTAASSYSCSHFSSSFLLSVELLVRHTALWWVNSWGHYQWVCRFYEVVFQKMMWALLISGKYCLVKSQLPCTISATRPLQHICKQL